MSKHVRRQKIKVVRSHKDASHTENSQYWDDVRNGRWGIDEVGFREHPQANPDMFPEKDNTSPSSPQLLMGEAIEHLQGRQRECYILTMREDKSLSEAAEILGISRSAIQQYRRRAVEFIRQYCEAAMARGRV